MAAPLDHAELVEIAHLLASDAHGKGPDDRLMEIVEAVAIVTKEVLDVVEAELARVELRET